MQYPFIFGIWDIRSLSDFPRLRITIRRRFFFDFAFIPYSTWRIELFICISTLSFVLSCRPVDTIQIPVPNIHELRPLTVKVLIERYPYLLKKNKPIHVHRKIEPFFTDMEIYNSHILESCILKSTNHHQEHDTILRRTIDISTFLNEAKYGMWTRFESVNWMCFNTHDWIRIIIKRNIKSRN